MMPKPKPDWAYACQYCGHSWWSAKPPENPPRQCNKCGRRPGVMLVTDPHRVRTRSESQITG